MIDREKILALLEVSKQHGATVEMAPSELAELCRVYLAWLDAPEGLTFRNEYGATEMADVFLDENKRVRLVEVKE